MSRYVVGLQFYNRLGHRRLGVDIADGLREFTCERFDEKCKFVAPGLVLAFSPGIGGWKDQAKRAVRHIDAEGARFSRFGGELGEGRCRLFRCLSKLGVGEGQELVIEPHRA